MFLTQHIPYDRTYVFHTETGEIMYSHKDMKKPRKVASVKEYVGNASSPFPCECRGPEQLIESVSNLDGYVADGCNVSISHELLALSVVRKYLTQQQLSILYTLAERVAAWNYVYTSIQELCDILRIGKTNIMKTLGALSSYVQVERNEVRGKGRGHLVLRIHPAYVWRGDVSFRNVATQRWVDGQTTSFGSVLTE